MPGSRISGGSPAASACPSRADGVPYAVTLRIDADAAAPIEAMWRALADRGLHDDGLRLGYKPHITLTVHPDGVNEAHLRGAVRHCADGWDAMALRVAAFGVFAAPVPVLYLAPVVTPALLLRQQVLAEALSDLPFDPHYRPGAWVPHVTLAKGGPAAEPGWMGRAIDCLAPLWSDLRPGWSDRLDIVHFRPVSILESLVMPPRLAVPATSV